MEDFAADHVEQSTETIKSTNPSESQASKPEGLPPYKVLLHNDDSNPMDYVADTILSVIQLKPFESHQKMLEAHNTGVSVLLVTDQE